MRSIIFSFFINRELIFEMAIRDLRMINKGALLGYAWLILLPLFQTGAYVLIGSFIFGSRLSENSGVLDYALYVLGGMVPWTIINKMLSESSTQLYSRMELIKQFIYPIETLPMTSLIVGSFGSLVSLLLFITLSLMSVDLSWTILLIPIPMFLLIVFVVGMSWILSIIGIFLKDLREIVTIVLGILVFFTPVVASPEIVGEKVWQIILFNPLSHIVICFRDVYYFEFNPTSWLVFILLSFVALFIGGAVISRAKLVINQYI